MLLMVGLPGAGKTTRAKELAAAHRALRLTPDHWMIPLFGESMADGKRFVLEGRLISVALQALRLGTSVVLDFGLWGRDERSALRWLARSAGAACQVIYLPVDKDVQLARIAHRQATAPHQTFPMSEADVDQWRKQFQVPDAAELGGGEIPGPPAGGRAGRNGQQTTGPHAPTANLTVLPRAVLTTFGLASEAGVWRPDFRLPARSVTDARFRRSGATEMWWSGAGLNRRPSASPVFVCGLPVVSPPEARACGFLWGPARHGWPRRLCRVRNLRQSSATSSHRVGPRGVTQGEQASGVHTAR